MSKTPETKVLFQLLVQNTPHDSLGQIMIEQRTITPRGRSAMYDLSATLDGNEYLFNGMGLTEVKRDVRGSHNYTDEMRKQSDQADDVLWPAAVLGMKLMDSEDFRNGVLDREYLGYLSDWVNRVILEPQNKVDPFLFQNMEAILGRSVLQVVIAGKDFHLRSMFR